MKVFIVGGTGLLGSAAAKELVARGHEVVSLSLPPLPEGAVFPPQMKIEYGNYLELSDEDFRAYFRGCDAFVFAAGVDERVEAAPPVYELYRKYNIAPTERLLRLAKECGVKRAAICGSYFAYFAGSAPNGRWTEIIPISAAGRSRRNSRSPLPTKIFPSRCWSSRIFSARSRAENPYGSFSWKCSAK